MKSSDYLTCLVEQMHTTVDDDGIPVTDACTGCRACEAVCPQSCIDFSGRKAVIQQKNCLHCGNCMNVCPQKAVIREG